MWVKGNRFKIVESWCNNLANLVKIQKISICLHWDYINIFLSWQVQVSFMPCVFYALDCDLIADECWQVLFEFYINSDHEDQSIWSVLKQMCWLALGFAVERFKWRLWQVLNHKKTERPHCCDLTGRFVFLYCVQLLSLLFWYWLCGVKFSSSLQECFPFQSRPEQTSKWMKRITFQTTKQCWSFPRFPLDLLRPGPWSSNCSLFSRPPPS